MRKELWLVLFAMMVLLQWCNVIEPEHEYEEVEDVLPADDST